MIIIPLSFGLRRSVDIYKLKLNGQMNINMMYHCIADKKVVGLFSFVLSQSLRIFLFLFSKLLSN